MRQHSARIMGLLIGSLVAGVAPAIDASERPAWTVGVCTADVVHATQAHQGGGHQRHDAATGLQFTAGMDDQRRAVLRVAGPGFAFEKFVDSSGDTRLRIASGGDNVSVSFVQNVITVGRGRTTVGFDPRVMTEADENRVRRLLVGSRAVRAFRAIAAQLEAAPPEEDDAFVTAALLDASLVGYLDGDDGAIGRVGRRSSARQRARLRPAAARAQGRFEDCVGSYENTVNWAWNEYGSCTNNASDDPWYVRGINMNFCTAEWIARGEIAWFQFISCIPLMS